MPRKAWLPGRPKRSTVGMTWLPARPRRSSTAITPAFKMQVEEKAKELVETVLKPRYVTPKPKKIEESKTVATIFIKGADVDSVRSFAEVYSSNPEPKIPVCITYHWRIFRAKTDTATLTVSDWESPNQSAPPFGQEQAFNFLEIQPYRE